MSWRDLFRTRGPEEGDDLDGCELDFHEEPEPTPAERQALLVPYDQEDDDDAP